MSTIRQKVGYAPPTTMSQTLAGAPTWDFVVDGDAATPHVSVDPRQALVALRLRPMTFELRHGSAISITPDYLPETDEVAFDVRFDGDGIDLPLPSGTIKISGQNRVVMPRETFLHAQDYVMNSEKIPRLSAFLAQVYGRRPLLTR